MIKEKLTAPATIKRIMQKRGLKFTKSLGQNFLTDANIIEKIVETAGVGEDDFVIEIGPGIGGLTQGLLGLAGSLLAIEIDKKFIPILQDNFADCPNFNLIQADALKLDIYNFYNKEKLASFEEKESGGPIDLQPYDFIPKRRMLVANLPYYITSPILERFFSDKVGLDSLTVLVQKELAVRMTAGPGDKDYSSLSLMVKLFGDAKYAFSVPASVFMPKPKVDSALVKIVKKDRGLSSVDKSALDFLIREAFKKRRKMVVNTLAQAYENLMTDNDFKQSNGTKRDGKKWDGKKSDAKKILVDIFQELGLDLKARPENLSLDDFIGIYKELKGR